MWERSLEKIFLFRVGYLLAPTFTKHFGQLKIHVFIDRVSGWLGFRDLTFPPPPFGGRGVFPNTIARYPLLAGSRSVFGIPITSLRIIASLAHGRLARNPTTDAPATCLAG
jgi:hypothetical protein